MLYFINFLFIKTDLIKHYSSDLFICDLKYTNSNNKRPMSCQKDLATNWDIKKSLNSAVIRNKNKEILDISHDNELILVPYSDSDVSYLEIDRLLNEKIRLIKKGKCLEYNLLTKMYEFNNCTESEDQLFKLLSKKPLVLHLNRFMNSYTIRGPKISGGLDNGFQSTFSYKNYPGQNMNGEQAVDSTHQLVNAYDSMKSKGEHLSAVDAAFNSSIIGDVGHQIDAEKSAEAAAYKANAALQNELNGAANAIRNGDKSGVSINSGISVYNPTNYYDNLRELGGHYGNHHDHNLRSHFGNHHDHNLRSHFGNHHDHNLRSHFGNQYDSRGYSGSHIDHNINGHNNHYNNYLSQNFGGSAANYLDKILGRYNNFNPNFSYEANKVNSLYGGEAFGHHNIHLDDRYNFHHNSHNHNHDFDDFPNYSNEHDFFSHGHERYGLYRGHQCNHKRRLYGSSCSSYNPFSYFNH